MATIQGINNGIREFALTAEGRALDLQLNLAEIILRGLKAKGWSQSQLAKAIGKKPSFVSRLVHSEANCTFRTVGLILHAFGVSASLAVRPDSDGPAAGGAGCGEIEFKTTFPPITADTFKLVSTHGKVSTFEEVCEGEAGIIYAQVQ